MSLLKPQQHLILCPPNKQKTKSGNTDFAAQVKMERSSANFPFSITSLCFFYLAMAQDGTVCNFRQTFNTVFISWTNGGRWCPSSPAILQWPWPVGNVLILFHNAKQPLRSDWILGESVSRSRWKKHFQLFVISTEKKTGQRWPHDLILSFLFPFPRWPRCVPLL